MRIERILWLESVVAKLHAKHAVSTVEAGQVLTNSDVVRFVERGKIQGEDLFLALGRTDAGRHLAVFFIHKQRLRIALPISARNMSQAERDIMPRHAHVRDEIPESFGSIEEAAEFWDTHDVTDYLDLLGEVDADGRPVRRGRVEIQIPVDLLRLLEERARNSGRPVAEIIEELLRRGLSPAA